MYLACFILYTLLDCGMSQLKPGQLNSYDIKIVLDVHNYYRRLQNSSNMNLLKWDDTLAEMAYNYLQNCLNEHGQPDTPQSPFYATGQNIYAVTPWRVANYSLAVQRWYEEIKYFNYDQNTCSKICGHYTQVVWADTIFVGCASVNCTLMRPQGWRNVTMILCNYGPGGNFPDVLPFERGITCDMCQLDVECVQGLCDSDY